MAEGGARMEASTNGFAWNNVSLALADEYTKPMLMSLLKETPGGHVARMIMKKQELIDLLMNEIKTTLKPDFLIRFPPYVRKHVCVAMPHWANSCPSTEQRQTRPSRTLQESLSWPLPHSRPRYPNPSPTAGGTAAAHTNPSTGDPPPKRACVTMPDSYATFYTTNTAAAAAAAAAAATTGAKASSPLSAAGQQAVGRTASQATRTPHVTGPAAALQATTAATTTNTRMADTSTGRAGISTSKSNVTAAATTSSSPATATTMPPPSSMGSHQHTFTAASTWFASNMLTKQTNSNAPKKPLASAPASSAPSPHSTLLSREVKRHSFSSLAAKAATSTSNNNGTAASFLSPSSSSSSSATAAASGNGTGPALFATPNTTKAATFSSSSSSSSAYVAPSSLCAFGNKDDIQRLDGQLKRALHQLANPPSLTAKARQDLQASIEQLQQKLKEARRIQAAQWAQAQRERQQRRHHALTSPNASYYPQHKAGKAAKPRSSLHHHHPHHPHHHHHDPHHHHYHNHHKQTAKKSKKSQPLEAMMAHAASASAGWEAAHAPSEKSPTGEAATPALHPDVDFNTDLFVQWRLETIGEQVDQVPVAMDKLHILLPKSVSIVLEHFAPKDKRRGHKPKQLQFYVGERLESFTADWRKNMLNAHGASRKFTLRRAGPAIEAPIPKNMEAHVFFVVLRRLPLDLALDAVQKYPHNCREAYETASTQFADRLTVQMMNAAMDQSKSVHEEEEATRTKHERSENAARNPFTNPRFAKSHVLPPCKDKQHIVAMATRKCDRRTVLIEVLQLEVKFLKWYKGPAVAFFSKLGSDLAATPTEEAVATKVSDALAEIKRALSTPSSASLPAFLLPFRDYVMDGDGNVTRVELSVTEASPPSDKNTTQPQLARSAAAPSEKNSASSAAAAAATAKGSTLVAKASNGGDSSSAGALPVHICDATGTAHALSSSATSSSSSSPRGVVCATAEQQQQRHRIKEEPPQQAIPSPQLATSSQPMTQPPANNEPATLIVLD